MILEVYGEILISNRQQVSKEFTIIDPETGISYTDTWAFSEKELNRLISERYIIFPKIQMVK